MADEQQKAQPDVEATIAELDAAAAAIWRARERLTGAPAGMPESVCGFMPSFD